MKTIFLFLALCVANFSFAQDLEDRDDSFITENNKNILKIDIKEPFMQVAVKCNDFKPAAYEGGAAAYKEILRKYMYTYLNSDFYTFHSLHAPCSCAISSLNITEIYEQTCFGNWCDRHDRARCREATFREGCSRARGGSR